MGVHGRLWQSSSVREPPAIGGVRTRGMVMISSIYAKTAQTKVLAPSVSQREYAKVRPYVRSGSMKAYQGAGGWGPSAD